jgi:hypothetical protein
MVRRRQGGLDDDMGSREVDDVVGFRKFSAENFGSLTA